MSLLARKIPEVPESGRSKHPSHLRRSDRGLDCARPGLGWHASEEDGVRNQSVPDAFVRLPRLIVAGGRNFGRDPAYLLRAPPGP